MRFQVKIGIAISALCLSLSAAGASGSALTTQPLPNAPQPQGFLRNRVNQELVAVDFGVRLLDAASTRQVMSDPCHCYIESGNFGLRSFTSSNAGQYTYSLAMAAGQAEAASLLWRHGGKSGHRKLYHLASRAVLLVDIVYDGMYGPVHNWTIPKAHR